MNPVVHAPNQPPNDPAGGWLAASIGAFGLLVVSAWIYHLQVVPPAQGSFATDLKQHLQFAQEFWAGKRYIPHPGFHFVTMQLTQLMGWSLETSAVVILTTATVISYWITFQILQYYLPSEGRGILCATIALALSIVSAIHLPAFSSNFYIGHGSPNIWHNPTWITAQPFALLGFFCAERWAKIGMPQTNVRLASFTSLALAVGTVFKPSFAVAFIPAFGVYFIWNFSRGERLFKRLLLFGLIVFPTLLILSLQYFAKYDQATDVEGRLVFAPFQVWSQKTSSIPISIFLTLAFPLAVLLMHSRQLRSQTGFCLAWILVIVAAMQRLLLAESGDRMMAGNWGWGYMFALKIVFLYSVIVVLDPRKPASRVKSFWRWLPLPLFFLHVGTGIVYLSRLLTGGGYQ